MKTISPEKFRNPPKEYTLAPFWFWNDSLEEDSIAFQLEEMYKKGVYECIIHARKGLEVEYLSDKWFDRIRFAAAYARKKGMKLWIYDEDNWPSGYAGGRVIADNADFAATCLSVEKIYPVMYEDITVEDIPGKELVAVVAVHKNEEFFDITDHENHCCKPWHSETLQWEVFVFRMEKCRHKPCYINSPYIDMLNPAATDSFIRHTHAEYKRRLPEFWGSTICGFFTDEPGFYQNYAEQAKNINTIIWTRDFPERFRERFGYDIILPLFAVWEEAGDLSARIRRDYYAAVSEFYCESYFRRIGDFLAADGLKLIGHLHKEEGLETLVQTEGGFFDCMAELDYPGIDCIDRILPRITEKLGSSAMRVLKKDRCFDEVFGTFGWELTPQEMKARTDLLCVQGVNMIIPHAFFSSIEGVRGHECPPSMFWQAGYWKYFRQYADYVRRLSYFTSCGRALIDVAVYYPEYSARAQFRPLLHSEAAKTDEYMTDIGDRLLNAGYDYDFLPDRGIENARAVRGVLKGASDYRAVILPNVRYVPLKTAKKLCAFAKSGGKVVCVGKYTPEGIGEEREEVGRLFAAALRGGNVLFADHPAEVVGILCGFLAPVCMEGDAGGVYAMRRKSCGTCFYYLVNTSAEPRAFTLRAAGESAEEWDIETGDRRPAVFTAGDGEVNISCTLAEYGSSIVAVSDSPAASAIPRAVQGEKKLGGVWQWSCGAASGSCRRLTFHAAGIHGFSGEVAFGKKIRVADPEVRTVLKLENVKDYVSVTVNGRRAGERLWAPYEFDLTGLLKKGVNELFLTVGNMLENEIEGTDRDAGIFGNVCMLFG